MDLRDLDLEAQSKAQGFCTPGACKSPYTRLVEPNWGEMDVFGIVNNIYYLRWVESVRFHYFTEVGIQAYFEQTNVGPILASSSMCYKFPVRFPDTLEVSVRVSELEKKRFVMDNRIWSQRHDRLVAYGSATIVMVDYQQGGRPVEVPEAIRAAIECLEASHPDA